MGEVGANETLWFLQIPMRRKDKAGVQIENKLVSIFEMAGWHMRNLKNEGHDNQNENK